MTEQEQKILKILSQVRILLGLSARGDKFDDLIVKVYREIEEQCEGLAVPKLPTITNHSETTLKNLIKWEQKVSESLRKGKFKLKVLDGGK